MEQATIEILGTVVVLFYKKMIIHSYCFVMHVNFVCVYDYDTSTIVYSIHQMMKGILQNIPNANRAPIPGNMYD